jgi:lipopolysaccharide export system permease protein
VIKKLDKLIVTAFLGPFFLTFVVVVFILLTIYLLSYIQDFIGKSLGFTVFSELIFYFSINMVPAALPLAVLLSSLMTYGNLGEHHELTAVKGSGISLIRAIKPVFLIVLVLTGIAFYFNNTIVPKANLKAFSLLYDIRQKKPAIDFKEGAFYNGLPGYSIKVGKKFPDGHSLKGVMIYNHTGGRGNTDLILADSGAMFTFNHEQYLSLELFNGTSYSEYNQNNNTLFPKDYVRNHFQRSKIVFSLASFVLNKTPEQLFASNKKMKDVWQLTKDADSLKTEYYLTKKNSATSITPFYNYGLFNDDKNKLDARKTSIRRMDSVKTKSIQKDSASGSQMVAGKKQTKEEEVQRHAQEASEKAAEAARIKAMEASRKLNKIKNDSIKKDSIKASRLLAKSKRSKRIKGQKKNQQQINEARRIDSLEKVKASEVSSAPKVLTDADKLIILNRAANQARSIKSATSNYIEKIDEVRRDANSYLIERDRKFTQSIACLIMFLIGAPLGAIIRKGGFGFPVLISIIFFILFYVFSIVGEKLAKEDVLPVWLGMWGANLILLPIGLFFLRQAKNDSRLFEGEVYSLFAARVVKLFKKRGKVN